MCDLCIAADHAVFGITEAKVGRGMPWAAPLTVKAARELVYMSSEMGRWPLPRNVRRDGPAAEALAT